MIYLDKEGVNDAFEWVDHKTGTRWKTNQDAELTPLAPSDTVAYARWNNGDESWIPIKPTIPMDTETKHHIRITELEKLLKELKINWKKILPMLKRKERKRMLRWYGMRMFT